MSLDSVYITWIILTGLAVVLDVWLIRWVRRNWQADESSPHVRVLGSYSPILTWLKYRRLLTWKRRGPSVAATSFAPSVSRIETPAAEAAGVRVAMTETSQADPPIAEGLTSLAQPAIAASPARVSLRWAAGLWAKMRTHGALLVEIGLILAWAVWVGRAYLDFNRFNWPVGREFGSQVLSHHLWMQWLRCGLCALWNGNINGGAPALADVFGSTLHPGIIITTLLWGVVNGAKVSLIVALWMAGSAQWWIAHILRLGRAARLWSAALVMVGGHIIGRLELGAFDLAFSTAACSLALAAALHLGVTGHRRAAILLALTGAMAIVSGQGYLQLALLSWAPALLFFVLDSKLRLRPVWREYVLALGLSILVAGIFFVPVAHFWPNVVKFTDPAFQSAQPLAYVPLNLVISDFNFLRGELLGKLPYPYLYNLFIGWTPILLALGALRFARREDYAALLCLGTGTVLMFVMASALPLRWLAGIAPEISGFRHPPLMAGLAIPAILGLAAYGLDRLIAQAWPQIILRRETDVNHVPSFSLAWVLAIPLLWSVQQAYQSTQAFLTLTNAQNAYEAISAMRTPSLQWVAPPFGEHFWVEPALDADLKISNAAWWTWGWKDRPAPQPQLIAERSGASSGTVQVGLLADVPIFKDPMTEYAYVDLGDQKAPCQASGSGGDLVVTCSTEQPGKLIVQDNSWTGWWAWRDQTRTQLLASRWLSTDAPAGEHTYRFRYLPWDALVGLVSTFAGLAACVYLWIRSESALRQPPFRRQRLSRPDRAG